ncbi:MAG: HAD family hydrolase [candidate division KSB1 bacterium]|nr:HAD family hydrolase [candidate division KSB1 bacterium]MDQ7065152.1 HAD family hydrolase [candidate division KSB1 bacterium]
MKSNTHQAADTNPFKNAPEIFQRIRSEVTVISFDLWGTLFDDRALRTDRMTFRERRIRYFQRALREAGVRIDYGTAKDAYQHARQVFDDYWRRQQAFDADIGMDAMLKFVGAAIPEPIRQNIIRYFQTVVNLVTLRMYPGTREAIHRLAGRYRLALISDTGWTPSWVLREQLRRNDILSCFALTIFSDETGVCKPHPSMFARVTDHFHVRPEQCMHVGDIPFTDLLGAKRAGFYAAWIYKPELETEITSESAPDWVAHSVAELTEDLMA